MARFQIMSDLHLESPAAYDVFSITPKAPYLALLGDIGNIKDEGFFHFLEAQLLKFEHVFFLLGNHEPYHSSWAKVKTKLQDFAEKIEQRRAAKKGNDDRLGKLVVLDRTRYDLSSEVTILGCTLYSQVLSSQHDRVSFGLNDFYHIEDWTVEQHCAEHKADLEWLNTQVAEMSAREPNRKIVIFTHHSPSTVEGTYNPAHKSSPLSSGFSTDLSKEECWVNPSVKFWAYGHTHFNCDFEDSATKKRLVTNQRGYYFAQATVFNPDRVYEFK
ncbi:hypothetical protein AYO21_00543 [Fonsecaea monophora]|uniref:Calcineurin-like phosphoesterase domain-containing protein n=1 Tax=Fonsecaea monophora TaxID=254056 RepID=A0A177FLR9_9EURO|nr:hypothetical protein AYO21_00543 [Fonsecaea monophora]OAG45195.1 hypothetical protein AYO21_00543 [Fonsecaea monophora]